MQLLRLRRDPVLLYGAKEYYRTRPAEFITDWMMTSDPRKSDPDMPTKIPFILFPKQVQLIDFFHRLLTEQEDGLVEKCRESGVTWLACGFAVWLWIFWEGAAVGFGSYKANLVDELGDPKSIFEKIRTIIRTLPREFLPPGFFYDQHMVKMRIINPDNGASIIGEVGDNMGRGGRTTIYFKDESAHYEHPELIEAALADNTRVQVDISTVHGIGNVFHRRRESGAEWNGGSLTPGKTNVFVLDWRDDPRKSQVWYDRRKQKAIDDGLLHVFYQEVDRNYAASVEGILIMPELVEAAVDAHIKLGLPVTGGNVAGLDIADGGRDSNAWARRKGIVLRELEEWTARDPGASARKAVELGERRLPVEVQYDCIGVGAGVKSEINRLEDDELLPKGISFVPWNAAEKVVDPEGYVIPDDPTSPLNEDYYANLKAQGWWLLRRRFEKTYAAVHFGATYDPDELISLDSRMTMLPKLKKELTQVQVKKSTTLKLLIEKTPEGTKSPNLGDATMMAYHPLTGLNGYDLIKAVTGK